jgi:hypothetical protein
MKSNEYLKAILSNARSQWDHAGTRAAVRANFDKVIKWRTPALGSEVYASDTEQKIVHHTCKSRACPSCGHRATKLWQREQWAALPDIPYAGVVFTMPDVLWPIFRENRHLLNDLPVLGAAVIQQWAKERYGVQLLVMVVRHTFGRHLNFNSHLHILVSASGFCEQEGRWIPSLLFDKKALMHRWRYAVITYLRKALHAHLLNSSSSPAGLKRILTRQYERWWNIYIDRFKSKEHFLRYAGRYVRRPPIVQYRFVEVGDEYVKFRTNDHKQRREVLTVYRTEDFIETLADHLPDHYKHAIGYFGLMSPRSQGRLSATIFALLGQQKRPRPVRPSWAYSIMRDFGTDPNEISRPERAHRSYPHLIQSDSPADKMITLVQEIHPCPASLAMFRPTGPFPFPTLIVRSDHRPNKQGARVADFDRNLFFLKLKFQRSTS